MITSLAGQIIVPEPTPINEPLFDMFESEDPPPHDPGKIPIEDNNLEERPIC